MDGSSGQQPGEPRVLEREFRFASPLSRSGSLCLTWFTRDSRLIGPAWPRGAEMARTDEDGGTNERQRKARQ